MKTDLGTVRDSRGAWKTEMLRKKKSLGKPRNKTRFAKP